MSRRIAESVSVSVLSRLLYTMKHRYFHSVAYPVPVSYMGTIRYGYSKILVSSIKFLDTAEILTRREAGNTKCWCGVELMGTVVVELV